MPFRNVYSSEALSLGMGVFFREIFYRQYVKENSTTVIALVDASGYCLGFSRVARQLYDRF